MFNRIKNKILSNINIAINQINTSNENQDSIIELCSNDTLKLIKDEFISFNETDSSNFQLIAELKDDIPQLMIFNTLTLKTNILYISQIKLNQILDILNIKLITDNTVYFDENMYFQHFYMNFVNKNKRTQIFPEEFKILFDKLLEITLNRKEHTQTQFSFHYNKNIELIDWGRYKKHKSPISIIYRSDSLDMKNHFRVDLDENNSLGFDYHNIDFILIFDELFKSIILKDTK